ncbi:MAG TPA: class I SAM-dependent methyltransferase [Verrucomicrobiae bacterium]|nr:class I SAM-dependent methyltransferase [Verrucomicrobiae bacterium]
MSRAHFSSLGASASNPSLLSLLGDIRSSLRGCQTVLDVGCGNSSPLKFVHGVQLVGMDGYAPALEEARKTGTHDEYVLGDVKKIGELLAGRKFDACIALDVIEHLEKADGWRMLESMERLATKRVVIFTPNGFMPQKSKDGDLQEHLSGWTADEMRSRGYRVLGMYGPKSMRGEYHRVKHQPRALWVLITLFLHYAYTRAHPEKSAAIFCVKDIART